MITPDENPADYAGPVPHGQAETDGFAWPGGVTPASLLYVPASNDRALARIAERGAEAVILDLEDGVAAADKPAARAKLPGALAGPLRPLADAGALWLRVNVAGAEQAADLTLATGPLRGALAGLVVPKVAGPGDLEAPASAGLPLLAMIECPAGVLAAPTIARAPRVAGLIAGLNDLAHALRLPPGAERAGTAQALGLMVLAARAAGIAMFDGVWNAFADTDGFIADTAIGLAAGCDGRTLIHPAQVAPCHAAYWPAPAAIADALALVARRGDAGGAQGDGAGTGRVMVEDMHVAAARRLIAAARARGLLAAD